MSIRNNSEKNTRRSAIVSRVGALLIAVGVIAQGKTAIAQPAANNDPAVERTAAARQAFEDDRFGLFIHWGVYSLLGKGASVMDRDKLPIIEYGKLPPRFNPTKFDADAWVKLAKAAGAKYITITSKHHDGFCMFASRLTDFDMVDATPYHGDPLKALAGACHEQKIKLFFYYSLLDWHHSDYFPLGKSGQASLRETRGDWKRYVAFYQGQVRELCTNYGEIGGIWFDGWWDRPEADWDLAATYKLIHELQPGALVGNNHHVAPSAGEDFQIFEQALPGDNATGINKAHASRVLPLETCLTINHSWGFSAADTDYKTPEEIIQVLIASAGRGANLLVNVGPRPDGTIDDECTQRLLKVGKWLETYGESLYGTRRGPIPPQAWGVSTTKGKEADQRIYLHVLKSKPGEPIAFDPRTSWTPFLFGKTVPLKLTRKQNVLELELPKDAYTPVDTIVVLRPQSKPGPP